MNGRYGWKNRQPYFASFDDDVPLFTVAGLWERWGDIVSATILTTDAVEQLANLHHRTPRVLADNGIGDWLDLSAWAANGDAGVTSVEMAGKLILRPINRVVGNVTNEGPHLLGEPDGTAPGRNEELFQGRISGKAAGVAAELAGDVGDCGITKRNQVGG